MRTATPGLTRRASASSLLILVFAIVTNIVINVKFTALADHFPFIGVAVWVAILLSIPVRRPDWEVLPETFKGTIFLLSLVTCASMMPVEKLPPASALAALSLGFVSAVFDNIPLTALALKQGGYDWGFLAYAVGFGGSMIWFGSSAGVALSNMYPEAKSVGNWLRHGWHVALAYVVGFAVLYFTLGWQPHEAHKNLDGTRDRVRGAWRGTGRALKQASPDQTTPPFAVAFFIRVRIRCSRPKSKHSSIRRRPASMPDRLRRRFHFDLNRLAEPIQAIRQLAL